MYLTSLNRLLQDPKTAQRVADAVEYATGLRLQDYNTKSRLRHLVLARALFAYYGTREHLEPIYIAELLNRERTATLYFTKRHDEEAQQSRLFAKVSADVREYLKLSQQPPSDETERKYKL